jgi:hypothetical protein
MWRTDAKEMIMGMFQTVLVGSNRVMAALVSELEIEFGHGVGETRACRFLEVEKTNFPLRSTGSEPLDRRACGTDDGGFALDWAGIFGRPDGKVGRRCDDRQWRRTRSRCDRTREFGGRSSALAAFADA